MGGSAGIISRIRGETTPAPAPAPAPAPGAAYQPPAASVYTPYSAQPGSFVGKTPAAPISPYQVPQPIVPSGLVQQMMARPPIQQFNPPMQAANQPMMSGLPAALAMLRGQLNQMTAPRPMQQMAPMPVYRPSALNYRPNMAPAQQSLGRVAVGVAEQQRRAAQAELDRMKTEQEEQARRFPYGDSGGSGGG